MENNRMQELVDASIMIDELAAITRQLVIGARVMRKTYSTSSPNLHKLGQLSFSGEHLMAALSQLLSFWIETDGAYTSQTPMTWSLKSEGPSTKLGGEDDELFGSA